MASDDKKSKSFLKGAVAATPALGTLGYYAYKGIDTSNQRPRLTKPSLQTAIQNARISSMTRNINESVNIDFIDDLTKKGIAKEPNITAALKTAWDQAVAGVSEFDQSKLPREMRSLEDVTPENVTETIKRFSKNTSGLNARIFGQFRNNFQALSNKSNQFFNFSPVKGLTFPTSSNLYDRPLPGGAQRALHEMADFVSPTKFYSSPGFAERGLGAHQIGMTVKGMNLDFTLPAISSKQSILVEGLTQSSRRIHQNIGVIDSSTGKIKSMHRSQFFLEELSKSIVPDIRSGRLRTQADVRSAMGKLYESVFGSLESIPNVDAELVGPKAVEYQTTRSKALQLVVENKKRSTFGAAFIPAFRKANTEETMAAIQRQGNLFGGVGSHSATGLVQTMDVREPHPFPKSVDFSRKPESGIRRFDLTSESRKAMGGDTPKLRTLYVNQDMIDQLGEDEMQALFGEGHAMGKRSALKGIEYQWSEDIHLKLAPDLEVSDFQKAIDENTIKPGTVLGWDEAGERVVMDKNMRLIGVKPNQTLGKGDFLTLANMRRVRIEQNAKQHGDFKALVTLVHDKFFDSTVRKITGKRRLLGGIDTIVTMDELKKDRGKFTKQILTGLEEVGKIRGTPYDTAVLIDRLNRKGILNAGTAQEAWSNEAFAREAVRIAGKERKFRSRDFAGIFGALPEVLEGGRGQTEQILKEELGANKARRIMKHMTGAYSFGVASPTFGGPESLRGAGVRGSFEPRTLEAFSGPAFGGQLGKELEADFIRRMTLSDPSKRATSLGLTKTLQSMRGIVTPGKEGIGLNIRKVAGADLADEVQGFIQRGGGWMRLGKGLPDVFVPNLEQMESLKPTTSAAGRTIVGDVSNIYHRIAQQAGLMYSDINPITPDEARVGMNQLMSEIHEQAAPGGKGLGGYLRGKVMGSRFLTGVDPLGKTKLGPMEVGITKKYAAQMFSEMAATGLYGADELAEMKTRFMQGNTVGGVLARHPTFGEYSAQQIGLKLVRGSGAQIQVPELGLKGWAEGVQEAITLKLGPMVGMAGDKDADLYAAFLVSPKLEETVRENVIGQDDAYVRNYLKYQTRYQMLKGAKATAVEGLPTMTSMIGEMQKLAVVPEWVAPLSNQMTSSRRALRAFGQGKAAADAEMLLTWLEQTPISSKHASVVEAAQGKLGKTMSLLNASLAAPEVDTEGIKDVIRTITKDSKIAESFLNQGVILDEKTASKIGATYGIANFDRNLGSLDVNAGLQELARASKQYEESGLQRKMELLVDQGARMRPREVPEFAEMAFDAGQKRGVASSRALGTARNMLAGIGKSLGANKKVVGFGFAGSLALGALLSSPRKSIGPGAGTIPPEGLIRRRASNTAANLKDEDIVGGTARQMGSPTAPSFTGTNRVTRVTTSPRRSYTVDAIAPNTMDNASIAGISRMIGGGSSQISVNLRDRRTAVNQFAEKNKY